MAENVNATDIVVGARDSGASKAIKELSASARAANEAVEKSARAAGIAAKYSGDAVSDAARKIIAAKSQERSASQDYLKLQSALRSGYLEEARGTVAVAAAYQRMTAARKQATMAAREQMTLMERFQKDGLAGLSNLVLPAGVGVAAGEVAERMHEAISSSAEFGETIAKAAERTGVAASTLSVLHYAAKVTGSDFDTLTTGVGRMGKNLADAADGNKKLAQAFANIGVNAAEVVNRHDALDIVLTRLQKTLVATESPARRNQLAIELLGKAGQESVPVLMDLAGRFDEFKSGAESAGLVINDLQAKKLADLNQKLNDLKERIQGAEVQFTQGLTPGMQEMFRVISGNRSSMDTMLDWGRDAGKVFASLAAVLYSAGAAAEYMFSASEGGKLTSAGRTDYAAAQRMEAQATGFANIVNFNAGALVPHDYSKDTIPGTPPGGGGGKGGNGGGGGAGAGSAATDAAAQLPILQGAYPAYLARLVQQDHAAFQQYKAWTAMQQPEAFNPFLAPMTSGLNLPMPATIAAPHQNAEVAAAREALTQFADSATDAARAVQQFTTNVLDTVNNTLLKQLTTRTYHGEKLWHTAGHDIFTSATGSLLRGAEGTALKALGIGGKKDGSSEAAALWVRMANAAKAGEQDVSGLFQRLFGGRSSGGASAAITAPFTALANSPAPDALGGTPMTSNLMASLAAGLMSFDVGTNYVPQDMIAMVHKGEAIVPAAYNDGGGGDTHHHHWNIDARGSTDPAAVRMQVMKGIMQAAPYIQRGAVHQMREQTKRLPTGKQV